MGLCLQALMALKQKGGIRWVGGPKGREDMLDHAEETG